MILLYVEFHVVYQNKPKSSGSSTGSANSAKPEPSKAAPSSSRTVQAVKSEHNQGA